MKVVNTAQMRQIELDCEGLGISASTLMENAGRAAAEKMAEILGAPTGKEIVLLVGAGNNGGDGLVAARFLHQSGFSVQVFMIDSRPETDINLRLVKELGVPCTVISSENGSKLLEDALATAAAVVDALLGTGKNRPLSGVFAEVLITAAKEKQKRPSLRIFALDLPSGLDADTGIVAPACLAANVTITFGFPKTGLFSPPGLEISGRLIIADIGIPPHLAKGVRVDLIDAGWAASVLPQRPLVANKGTFGKLLVVAGSINYTGAAYLAGAGALRVGAGRVTLAAPLSLHHTLAAMLPEVTHLPLPEVMEGVISSGALEILRRELENYDALLIGCGLGQHHSTQELVRRLLLSAEAKLPPMVVDADALNALAGVPEWWRLLAENVILTPHPGEMGRLTGVSVADVQKDRPSMAAWKAAEWRKTIVLKGAYSVVAALSGQLRINPIATPVLASAGTGDVLSGVIAGLLTQGVTQESAAACGVYMHSQAGKTLEEKLGDAGVIASDLLAELPLVIKRLKKYPSV